MRHLAEAGNPAFHRTATGATVVLFLAGCIVWMPHIRFLLAGNAGAPRVDLPRLEGIVIDATRRSGRFDGKWIAEGSELSVDGFRWRLMRLEADSAMLTCGRDQRRVPLATR